MMVLLGQHGQPQDYRKGLEYIRLAAQGCDENAPQGAYVSNHNIPLPLPISFLFLFFFLLLLWPGVFTSS
jgi:hypothetical protein